MWEVLKEESIKINEVLKLEMAVAIAQGMRYLHQFLLVHRDLKSLNILVGKNFGTSQPNLLPHHMWQLSGFRTKSAHSCQVPLPPFLASVLPPVLGILIRSGERLPVFSASTTDLL